jgi:hypothetical protein
VARFVRRGRVPGPVVRFARRPLRVVTVGLIGIILLSASFLQSASAELLTQTLDANWRGDYDILVTADGGSPLVAGGSTLLSGSALTDASLGHIPSALVGRVQGLDGVEVAAPIGQIATPTSGLAKVTLTIPLDGSNPGPRAYRATASLRVDDGLGAPRTVTRTLDFLVDQSAWRGYRAYTPDDPPTVRVLEPSGDFQLGAESDIDLAFEHTFGGADDAVQPPPQDGIAMVGLDVPTVETAHLVLVDPEAEKALLGDQGSVMDPLIETSPLIGRLSPEEYDPDDPPAQGDDLNALFDKGVVTMPTPVLVKTDAPPAADLDVELQRLDLSTEQLAGTMQWFASDDDEIERDRQRDAFPTELLAAAPPVDSRTVYQGRPGEALSPFSFDTVDIPWPGYTLRSQPFYADYPLFLGGGSVLPEVDPYDDAAARPLLQPIGPGAAGAAGGAGLQDAGDSASDRVTLRAADTRNGELLFHTLQPIPSVQADGQGPYEVQTWPVGTLDPATLHADTDDLGRLPLGYDEQAPTVVSAASADGGTVAGSTLPSSWSGLGLDVSGALAVADLDNAQYWQVEDPVTSIRVRVQGVGSYTPESEQRILDVASQIRALGLTATVVAGSSLETIPVELEAPDAGSASGGPVIAQQFSRLGAVALASDGVSGANLALLVVAMVAGTLLLVVVQLSSIGARRADSVVLRQIGWPTGRVRRWLAAEEAVPAAALVAVAATAVAISAVRDAVWPLAAVAVAAGVLSSAVLVRSGASARRPRVAGASGRLRRARLAAPARLGLRQARTNPVSAVVLALAFALVVAAAATAVLVLADGRERAGASRLGTFATAQAALPQGALIAVTLVAGCVLVVVVRRLGVERRAAETGALRAMGWQRRHLLAAAAAEVLASAVPGLIVGAAVSVLIAAQLLPAALPVALAVAVAVTAAVTALTVRASLPRR